MEKTLLIATGNQHKVTEIAAIFADSGLSGWRLLDLSAYPDYQPPEEDGDTFTANAALKALAAAEMSGLLTLADDSGLSVDALDGAPGVHSARYAGEGRDDAANRVKLLAALADVPEQQRAAAFVCVAALAFPSEEGLALWSAEGRVEGRIALAERGDGGFGYDNLFYLPPQGQTMAELAAEEKNRLSHRYLAMRRVAELLQQLEQD